MAPGIIIQFSDDEPQVDAADRAVMVTGGLYNGADDAKPARASIVTVPDVSAVPPTTRERRVYKLLHDAAHDAHPGDGKILFVMGVTPSDAVEMEQWHVDTFPLMRTIPGWVRTRGFRLEEQPGKPADDDIPRFLGFHEWAGEFAFETEQFELYVNDKRRTEIVKKCTTVSRRFFLLDKLIS